MEWDFENLWPIIVVGLVILWHLVKNYLRLQVEANMPGARDGKAGAERQIRSAYCYYLAAFLLLISLAYVMLSPGQPGRFSSTRIDLEGLIALRHHGETAHTPGHLHGGRSFLDDDDDFGDHIVDEQYERNPYIHYINPYVFGILLIGAVGCAAMALVMKIKDLLFGKALRARTAARRRRTGSWDW
jgi:hypothetical protein